MSYTVKGGVVYDAKQLLADVRALVAQAKRKENFQITQPGTSPKAAQQGAGKQ